MRSFTTIALAALLASLVDAKPRTETNAQRMARGLPPNAPRNLYKASPVAMARRSQTSETPSQCNAGPVQCCSSVTHANDDTASFLLDYFKQDVSDDTAVGMTCSPLSVIGIGGNSCSSQPVCCENNNFNGIIAIGCSPININL
ncbi:fungal hydrophobin [Flagelloscypha sp. PMI_526]|nr:fungal hydrophobin [Flagelloscypha sp. PMI_526]